MEKNLVKSNWFYKGHRPICLYYHSDLNDQNLFHSTIDEPPGVPGVSKNPDHQTEVLSGGLVR